MIEVRSAALKDARGIAEVYVESWRETYAGVLPNRVLLGLSANRLMRSWHHRVGAVLASSSKSGTILVAEHDTAGIVGFGDGGPSRDWQMSYRAEVYALYVAPNFIDRGVGRTLIRKLFDQLISINMNSAIIWALADNPNRHFYTAIGGQLAAERMSRYWGEDLREMGYGWSDLKAWRDQREVNEAVSKRNRNDGP